MTTNDCFLGDVGDQLIMCARTTIRSVRRARMPQPALLETRRRQPNPLNLGAFNGVRLMHVFPPMETPSPSRREDEIIRQLAIGATGPEIALRLELSLHTVRTHIRNIYQKLGVTNRVELLLWQQSRPSSGSTTEQGEEMRR